MNTPIEMQNTQEPGSAQYYDVNQETPLREYIAIILRGKWVILLTLVLVVGAVGAYTFTVKPVYESSSLVLVDMKGKDGDLPVFDITGTATANKITNELEILKSNATAESVARALLLKRYVDGDTAVQLEIIAPDNNAQPGDSLATVEMVVERLSKTVDFTPIRESDIIRLTARSTNPKEAAMIANVYMGMYASRNLDNSRLRSQAVREFLQDQLKSKRSVLDTTENDLQQYMRASGVVSLDAEANKVVEQLSQLEAQRDGFEVDKSSRLKALASYKEELARQEPNAAKAIGESNDTYIKLLQEQLAKLEVQRDVTIAQNPDVVQEELYSETLKEINNQIKEIKKRLDERTKIYLNSLLPGDMTQGAGNGGFIAQIKQKIIEQQIEIGSIDARINALNGVLAEYEKKFNQI
ncbi:MAG: GumC family protein, partial [Acidobacteriota bacterium]